MVALNEEAAVLFPRSEPIARHSAPVFEGDILNTEVEVVATLRLDHADATLADLRATVHADRGTGEPPEQVLDWAFVGVLA